MICAPNTGLTIKLVFWGELMEDIGETLDTGFRPIQ